MAHAEIIADTQQLRNCMSDYFSVGTMSPEEMHRTCWSGVKKPASAHFSISLEENGPWMAPLGSTYSHSVGLLNLGVPALTNARLHSLRMEEAP